MEGERDKKMEGEIMVKGGRAKAREMKSVRE